MGEIEFNLKIALKVVTLIERKIGDVVSGLKRLCLWHEKGSL